MKAQELRELRELPVPELTGKLKDSRRELYELRFKMAVGQLDNHRQIRQVRRDIARILTLIHEREDTVMVPSTGKAAERPEATKAESATVAEAAEEEESVDVVETETVPDEEES